MSTFSKSLSWMSLAIVVSKLSSVITQVALGHLLLAEQFGMYAFIIGGMGLIAGFMDTGISKLLIRAQEGFFRYKASAILITAGMAVTGSLLLLLYVWLKEVPQEVWLAVFSIALTIPIFALAQIDKARLSINLELPYISRIEVFQSLLYSVILVLMAFSGYGVEGFGVATAAGYCFVALMYRVAVRRRIYSTQPKNIQKTPLTSLLWELRWLILTTFAMGLALRGDYVVLGHFIDNADLGVYYFSFMLTANVGLLIAASINSAFMPFLVRKIGDPNALREFFLENSLMFLFLTTLLAGGFICVSKDAIHIIWNGRWDLAALPAVLLAITLPLKMLAPMSYALLESLGLWHKRFLLVTADAVTVILAVATGAKFSGLFGAVMALTVQRGLIGFAIFLFSCRLSGIKLERAHFIAPLLVTLVMGGISLSSQADLPYGLGSLLGLAFLFLSLCILVPTLAPELKKKIFRLRGRFA